jgi:subtilase family serine protease
MRRIAPGPPWNGPIAWAFEIWGVKMALKSGCLILLTGLLALSGVPTFAEEAIPGRPLLSAAVDERQVLTVEGNTRPEARLAGNDRGAVAASLQLEHVHLQLKRSPAQEAAVAAYVDSLTERGSPNYHHWLTADEFGQRFGIAQSDIERITAWLKTKGLKVNFVYPSRMVIDFSGTASQVSRAFNAEIHRLEVDGVSHIANMHDPQIPAALAPAVEGIVSLHDFRPHNNVMRPRAMLGDAKRPDATGHCFGQPCYDVAPGDLATIYGLKALFNAGYSGQGQVIATVEDTNLFANSDWTTFRSVFGLNKYAAGSLTVVHPAPKNGKACGNPGVNEDDGEATLDVEWASAAAPSATIELASCAGTFSTSGVYLAIQNLVNSVAPPPVISVSYGLCEVDNGATENATFNRLYQQAAIEGISVFVATGDGGPTDCASTSASGTTYGIGVTGWGSTRYNVAVGGTDFRDTFDNTNAAYWTVNTGAPWATAKSYVPEMPWNDTCANAMVAKAYGNTNLSYGSSGFCNTSMGASFRILGGGEGGPSGCYAGAATTPHVVSGTCKGYPKPTFQLGVLGMPHDGVRDIPDVSLFASDGSVWSHNYATCFTDSGSGGGPCTGNPVNWAANAGGTSYAAPIMAAIQALVDQYTKARQGNPLPTYYALAKAEYGTLGNPGCSADKGRSIGSNCVFYDIVSGDNIQDCRGTVDCYRPGGTYGVLSTVNSAYRPGYRATSGYDLATGLGSVNAYNLATTWPK